MFVDGSVKDAILREAWGQRQNYDFLWSRLRRYKEACTGVDGNQAVKGKSSERSVPMQHNCCTVEWWEDLSDTPALRETGIQVQADEREQVEEAISHCRWNTRGGKRGRGLPCFLPQIKDQWVLCCYFQFKTTLLGGHFFFYIRRIWINRELFPHIEQQLDETNASSTDRGVVTFLRPGDVGGWWGSGFDLKEKLEHCKMWKLLLVSSRVCFFLKAEEDIIQTNPKMLHGHFTYQTILSLMIMTPAPLFSVGGAGAVMRGLCCFLH